MKSYKHAIKQELMSRSVYHNLENLTDDVDYCITMFDTETNNILKVHSCKSPEALNWLIDTLLNIEIILIPNDAVNAWLFEDNLASCAKYTLVRKQPIAPSVIFVDVDWDLKMLERWLEDPTLSEFIICMEDTKEFVLCHVCMNRTCINFYKKILICPYCRCSI